MVATKKFGVVICPKCHHPRGVRLQSKSSECYKCRYRFKLKGLKRFYETDSESDLAEAVGRVNAKLQGGLEEYNRFLKEYENVPVGYEDLKPHKRIAAKLRHINDGAERLERLAIELDRELKEFEENDIIEIFQELGLKGVKVKESVQKLVEMNLIYEPRPGIFKMVG